jgi:hypothetical protein
MRDFRMWTLALAVLMSSGLQAGAAEGKKKPVPEEGAVQVVLLRHRSVREALKLTEDETKKIHEFTSSQWKKAQLAEDLTNEEARDRAFAALTKENEQFLTAILEPDQLKRLNQITLHVAGLLWVTRPEIASALKLTAEQKAKAVQLQADARVEMEDLLHSKTRRDRHEKLRELHATSKKDLLELLTEEQETKWKELAGEPFHGELRFDEPRPESEK